LPIQAITWIFGPIAIVKPLGRQRLGLKNPRQGAPKAKPTACPKWAEPKRARLARQPSFARKINQGDFALAVCAEAKVLHESDSAKVEPGCET
jgi:hypothetical protein